MWSVTASTHHPLLFPIAPPSSSSSSSSPSLFRATSFKKLYHFNLHSHSKIVVVAASGGGGGGIPLPPLDLTEPNVLQVLADARLEFAHVFDVEAGMTGEVGLVELDGPFVKISLRGRFWHERSMVLARVGNYLKQRIPEILEVDIEDEKQLDDSPENF